MLSLSTKSGANVKELTSVADYPDENRNKSKEVGAVEDYYSQGSEATPSRWLGSAAPFLGLSGPVNRDDHLKTLQGLDPRTGESLVQGAGPSRKYAVDLTFSSPKSVSIAWAVGDENIRKGIEAAQDRAVEKTLAFIEESFALGRRGSSKEHTIVKEKMKLLAAAFRHGSSREMDPQVHTHLMLQNLGLRADGTWGALNEKELFEWKMALGAAYRSELSSELNKNLGFEIESDREFFRLKGIPKELEEEFSKRRAQIEAALDAKGFSGAKASEIAALDTRKGKDVLDSEILREEWRKIAGEYGVLAESVSALRGDRAITSDEIEPDVFKKLTSHDAVFQAKDIVRQVAVGFSQSGKGLDDVKSRVSELLKDPEIVKLRGKNGATYYTTREMLALEKAIQQSARAGKEDRAHVLSKESVSAGIARFENEKGFSLSNEQRKAIEHLTMKPGRIQILEGHAGAGKSTALVPVRYALEASGFDVVGCSLQGKKAAGLEKDTGIKSQTIASLLLELQGYEREDGTQAPPTKALTEKSVIVVDEAAMNDSRLMAGLIRETEKAGAKLLLVGDESQVPPVAAGNPFRTLKKELGFAELTENRRQRPEWQKEASREIRSGQVKEGLQKYLDAGMISVVKDRDEAVKKTVESWSSRFDTANPEKTILTAYKKVDVWELNMKAREVMQERDLFTGPRIETTVRDREGNSEGKREFQSGDRIYFKKNDKKMGVKNGETGTLTKINVTSDGSECTFFVKMDNGKELQFDPRDYAQIDYGYALTIHKSQGETVDFSSNLVAGSGLNALYVQLTRHRDGTQITMTEDQLNKIAQNNGLELVPTEKMSKYASDLSEKLGIALPEGVLNDFDECRRFLNENAPELLPERDLSLEKVSALLESFEKTEKLNALYFEEVEPEPEEEKEKGAEIEADKEPEHEKTLEDRELAPVFEKAQERQLVLSIER